MMSKQIQQHSQVKNVIIQKRELFFTRSSFQKTKRKYKHTTIFTSLTLSIRV